MGLATTFFEVQQEDVTYYGVGRNCCGELGIEKQDEIVSVPQPLLLSMKVCFFLLST
jgi:hypothetical protein